MRRHRHRPFRIAEVKDLVFDAFIAARERSDDAARFGALWLDTT